MRKIIQARGVSLKNRLSPTIKVVMINEDRTVTTLMEKEPVPTNQPRKIYLDKEYSVEDYARIELCNSALLEHNLPEMTTREAEYMLSVPDIQMNFPG